MLHDLRRHGSLTRAVILCLTLLARLFLFSLRLLRIGLDETRRRRLELLQFLDAFQCNLKPPLGLIELVSRLFKGFSQGLVFLPQLGDFFLYSHDLSVSDKVKSEQFLEGKPHDYLPDVVGTITNGKLFIAEAGMEDDKRQDRNLAKAEAARRLARTQRRVYWIGTERPCSRSCALNPNRQR